MHADVFESPLTLAACGSHVELAMLLLERRANIVEVLRFLLLPSSSPPLLLLCSWGPNPSLFTTLSDFGLLEVQGKSPL